MIKQEDLNSISQLVESIELASKELEKALDKKDKERFDKAKKEILRFKLQINEVIG